MNDLQITYKDILQCYGEAMLHETGEEIALFAISFENFTYEYDSRSQETKIVMYDFRVMHEPGVDEVTIYNNGHDWRLWHMKSWEESGYELQ